jgi:uncharacterized membrane protein
MTHWQVGSMSGWGLVVMITGMLIFAGAVAFGAIAWARFAVVAGTSPVALPAPELVLAERLANGEIDIEEYERRLIALHNDPAVPYEINDHRTG